MHPAQLSEPGATVVRCSWRGCPSPYMTYPTGTVLRRQKAAQLTDASELRHVRDQRPRVLVRGILQHRAGRTVIDDDSLVEHREVVGDVT